MKRRRIRPEGAQYLAQGKAYSPPPWVNGTTIISSRPVRARDKTVQYLAPSGRLIFVTHLTTQGGAEYRLPWARYQAPSGRMFDKTRYFDAQLFCIFNPYYHLEWSVK